VTPRDALGALGGTSPILAIKPSRFEEGSSLMTRKGTWRTATSSSYSGGKAVYATSSGASATFTFNGRTAAFVAPRSKVRSSVRVYLDGSLVKTYSLYSATAQHRVVLYSTGLLPYGRHTVRVVNAYAGGRTRADVDAFVVFR
jgi:hypothetical protein